MYSGSLSVESVAEICFPHLPWLGKISTWVWAGFKTPSLSPCRLRYSCQTFRLDDQHPSLLLVALETSETTGACLLLLYLL